jgi:hypothetical protein
MLTSQRSWTTFASACVFALLVPLAARCEEPRYAVIGLDQIHVADRAQIDAIPDQAMSWWWDPLRRPYVTMDGGIEAYIVEAQRLPVMRTVDRDGQRSEVPAVNPSRGYLLAIAAPAAGDVRGQIFVPSFGRESRFGKPSVVPFSVSADQLKGGRTEFLRAKRAYYVSLQEADIPGTAWYRHQVRELNEQLGDSDPNAGNNRRRFFGNRQSGLEQSFAFLSGGRAVSENLALDREIGETPEASESAERVPIDSIEGITIREFNWQPLIEGKQPDLDPLASWIPADQHALFFPSFDAMVTVVDEVVEKGTPLLRIGEPRGEDAMTRERYQKQLGLSLNDATRLIGPRMIDRIAITGGDLYLRTGTDVAVLFETSNPTALRTMLDGMMALSAGEKLGVEPQSGEIAGVGYTGLVSPDRSVCSYIATLPNAVLVSNSLVQMGRIIACNEDRSKSLAALPEYTYFRDPPLVRSEMADCHFPPDPRGCGDGRAPGRVPRGLRERQRRREGDSRRLQRIRRGYFLRTQRRSAPLRRLRHARFPAPNSGNGTGTCHPRRSRAL